MSNITAKIIIKYGDGSEKELTDFTEVLPTEKSEFEGFITEQLEWWDAGDR